MEELLHYAWKHKIYPLGALYTSDGKPVEKAREAALYQELDIKFSDDVLRVSSKGGKGKNIIQKKTKKTEDNKQGRLL